MYYFCENNTMSYGYDTCQKIYKSYSKFHTVNLKMMQIKMLEKNFSFKKSKNLEIQTIKI